MKGTVFRKLFPHYYFSRFMVFETEVDFVRESDGIVIPVNSDFFKKMEYTKFLGISNEDQNYLRVHGIEKYKALKGAVDPAVEDREFHERYQAKLDADSNRRKEETQRQEEEMRKDVQRQEARAHKIREQQEELRYQQEQQREVQEEQEIEDHRRKELEREKLAAEKRTKEILEENKLWEEDQKYWQPRLWSSRGTVPTNISLSFSYIEVYNFSVYVNDTNYFPSQFQPLKIQWEQSKTSKNILEEKFDVKKDQYFCSLGAAFVLSYKCGFSQEHLKEQGIAGSLARYAIYFHLRRF